MPSLKTIPADAGARGTRLASAFAILAALLVVVYFAVPDPLLRDVTYDLLAALAALAVVVGIRVNRPEHPGAWYLIAAGTAAFAAGDALWTILKTVGETPFPSVADVAYLLGYPLLMIAFTRAVFVRVAGGDRSGVLDALIVSTAVALIGWVRLLHPVLETPGDPLAQAISVLYPLGDLVIIGVAIGLLTTPGARGASFAMLVVALLSQFVGDVLYAEQVAAETFVDGGLLDITWLLFYALLGVAALHPSMRVVAMPHAVHIAWLTRTRLTFMAIAMVTGPALVLLHRDDDVPLLVLGSTVLSLMVVCRMAVIVQALARDNALRQSLEGELSYRATHDPLTGLSNRRHFLELLEGALAERGGRPVTVLFLDLDDFKGINDTLGHAAGDTLLIAVARRIRGQLRDDDVAARMGGDEFGVLLRADEAVAMLLGQRLLGAFREPIAVGGQSVVTRGSIGVAAARPGVSTADLQSDADIAMYEAKALGKGRVCAYVAGMRDGVVARMQLEADLRAALSGGGLILDYQPVVDLRTGRVKGVEALVRWNHPTRGRLEPAAFVPLADTTGHGAALGAWVLDTAARQVAAWRATIDSELGLFVNLAPRQLAGPDLAAKVWAGVEAAGLPIGALVVDVTEGALLLDAPEVAGNLAALRALGARVAIDDFGTGYSSLGHLGRLPVDILKIDRAFVDRLDRDDDKGVAAIVVSLGETLGLETIAEGIERQGQLEAVQRLGCHLGQGFLLAAPMPPTEFEARYAPAAPRVADTGPLRRTVPSPQGA